MGRLQKIMEQIKREREAKLWLRDLNHYMRGTGKYATRQRDMLKKYHPNVNYICEVGRHPRLPWVRYTPLPINRHELYLVDSGDFHCSRCKFMGNVETFRIYNCI